MSAPVQAATAGVIPGMTREAYDKDPSLNWSKLKHLAKSPAHYLHALSHEREDTDALKRGRCVHLAVFEPERFERECVVWTGGVRRGKAWSEFELEHECEEILTQNEHDVCLALRDAVRGHPIAQRYLVDGRAEVSAKWTHSAPAVGALPGWEFQCKGRLDCVGPAAIVDLKTTRDASPEGFGKAVWSQKYHVQAAWYADGWERATGEEMPFVFVAVETEAPHVVQVYTVPEEILELGSQEYRALLQRLADCQGARVWGGYAEEEMALTLPRWATPRLDDDDATDLDLVFNAEG